MRNNVEFYAMRENCSAAYVERLRSIAKGIGLYIEHKAMVRVRGWPQKSLKPWSLRYEDGGLLCAFATLEQLERKLRARAGC